MAQEEELNCAPTGDAMAKRVQEVLHPGYVEKTAVPQKTTLTAIDNLLEEAGYCAAVARPEAPLETIDNDLSWNGTL